MCVWGGGECEWGQGQGLDLVSYVEGGSPMGMGWGTYVHAFMGACMRHRE